MSSQRRWQYDQSQINWEKLRKFAARVARETKVRPTSGSFLRQESRTRQVRAGMFGLSTRAERYSVSVPVRFCPDYWVLERRWYKKVSRGRVENTEVTDLSYCLGSDGSLFVLSESYEGIWTKAAGYCEAPEEPHTRPMNEADVQLFDFEQRNYHHADGPVTIDNNTLPDPRRLKFDSKGVGISIALKKLLGSP